MSLNQLLEFLRHTPAMLSKQAIAESVSMPNVESVNTLQALYAYPGDDTAAVAIQDQYLLHACEGMLPSFVANYPYFAGGRQSWPMSVILPQWAEKRYQS